MYNYRFLDCEAPVGAFFKDNALFGTFFEYCVYQYKAMTQLENTTDKSCRHAGALPERKRSAFLFLCQSINLTIEIVLKTQPGLELMSFWVIKARCKTNQSQKVK